MFFYYTGADDLDQPQSQIQKSLGGFRSSTRIPNSAFHNLFNDISNNDLIEGDEVIIGIVLKNETGTPANNVSIYVEVPSGSTNKFFVSAVTLINGKMEQISDNSQAPYIGNLVEMTGLTNKRVLVGVFEDSASIGLWIRRVVEPSQSKTCDQLYEDYKVSGIPNGNPIIESTTLILEWT